MNIGSVGALLRFERPKQGSLLLCMDVPVTTHPRCLPKHWRLRATFFGLAPEGCTAAECGDRVIEAAIAPPGQPAQLAASVAYPKPGRYVVRIEVRVKASC